MSLTWSGQKRFIYIGVLAAIVTVAALLVLIPYFTKDPTCYDRKQNGAETGIDCGGGCPLFCTPDALPLNVSWSRSLEVAPGRYNTVALIQNQNTGAGIYKIKYEFKLYDEDNIFLASRKGSTYINPNTKFAIFEPSVLTLSKIPFRTTFEFTEEPQWLNVSSDQKQKMSLFTTQGPLVVLNGESKMVAEVFNESFFDMKDIEVVATIFDTEENVIAVSQTYIQKLPKRSNKEVTFTWPFDIPGQKGQIDILPQTNIFNIGF